MATSLFSGSPAEPPSDDFIMRNSMNAQEVAAGWWPGDSRHPTAAFYAYAHPPLEGFAEAELTLGHWAPDLGEYLFEWDEVRSAPNPHAMALEFARSVFRHGCATCEWDQELAATIDAMPLF